MKTQIHFRVDRGSGARSHLSEMRRIFAEREKYAKEQVRSNHGAHLEFLEKRGISLGNLREASAKKAATAALAGLLVMTPVSGAALQIPVNAPSDLGSIVSAEDVGPKLAAKLKAVVPTGYENLSAEQEKKVGEAVIEVLNVRVSPEIGGHRLNRTFGVIGAEQHLYRYPGDSVFQHTETSQDVAMYSGAGIAPGLGAYGYFAPSKSSLTAKDVERERWYVVAQTFLAPGFKENSKETANFFKYRKFLVINPDSGQAVVGDFADSGPSEFTGKSFGGSPEVMQTLGYGGGSRKGRVIFFLLDDPKDKIPLGPISSAWLEK